MVRYAGDGVLEIVRAIWEWRMEEYIDGYKVSLQK